MAAIDCCFFCFFVAKLIYYGCYNGYNREQSGAK